MQRIGQDAGTRQTLVQAHGEQNVCRFCMAIRLEAHIPVLDPLKC